MVGPPFADRLSYPQTSPSPSLLIHSIAPSPRLLLRPLLPLPPLTAHPRQSSRLLRSHPSPHSRISIPRHHQVQSRASGDVSEAEVYLDATTNWDQSQPIAPPVLDSPICIPSWKGRYITRRHYHCDRSSGRTPSDNWDSHIKRSRSTRERLRLAVVPLLANSSNICFISDRTAFASPLFDGGSPTRTPARVVWVRLAV